MIILNARIVRTDLGFHDGWGSTPLAYIHVEHERGHQAFGGYCFGGTYTHSFLYGVLNALEAESWEKLTGMFVRVEQEHTKIHRIGHILKDKWFDPASIAKEAP